MSFLSSLYPLAGLSIRSPLSPAWMVWPTCKSAIATLRARCSKMGPNDWAMCSISRPCRPVLLPAMKNSMGRLAAKLSVALGKVLPSSRTACWKPSQCLTYISAGRYLESLGLVVCRPWAKRSEGNGSRVLCHSCSVGLYSPIWFCKIGPNVLTTSDTTFVQWRWPELLKNSDGRSESSAYFKEASRILARSVVPRALIDCKIRNISIDIVGHVANIYRHRARSWHGILSHSRRYQTGWGVSGVGKIGHCEEIVCGYSWWCLGILARLQHWWLSSSRRNHISPGFGGRVAKYIAKMSKALPYQPL